MTDYTPAFSSPPTPLLAELLRLSTMTKATTLLNRGYCLHPYIQCVLLQKNNPALLSPCLLLPLQYQAFLSVVALNTTVFLCMALAN